MKNSSKGKLDTRNSKLCIMALLLAFVILLSLLSSSFLLVETGDHHCEGHGCSVCAAVFQCLDHIRALSLFSLLALSLIIIRIVYSLIKPQNSCFLAARLPVTLKVRIND